MKADDETKLKPGRKGLRRIGVGIATLLALYLVSYTLLSITGGWIVTESGEHRFSVGLAESDCFKWQPRYGYCERFHSLTGYTLRADGLGWFFAPLILLDQRYVHPTIQFIGADGNLIEPFPAPALAQYHPLRANRFYGRFPYERPKH